MAISNGVKNVLFLAGTTYNLQRENKGLAKKFLGLNKGINVFVAARGRPWHKKIYDSEFYLVPAEWGILKWLFVFFRSFFICFRKNIQTVVVQSPLIDGMIGVILKKIFKNELIVEIHGDWIQAPFLYKRRKPFMFLKKITSFMAVISFKNADKIRGVAQYLIDKAKEIAPNKRYFLFPTFTDTEFFLEEKNTKFENFILFVGYLNLVKGVKYLIEAFAKIKDEFPEFQLVIIGDGPERQRLAKESEQLGIGKKVEFKGELSLEGVKETMKDCYCFVSPSLSEGLPLVLREAMALSKPVIATKVGGNADLIQDQENGFLVEPADINALAEKLKILLSNKKIAIETGQRAKQTILEKFSNEQYLNDYLSMINV